MSLPVVKPEIITNVGEQMQRCQNREYLRELESVFAEENPYLASICDTTLNVMNLHIQDPENLKVAQWVSRVTCLLMYNALKQQEICNELE